MDVVVAHRIEQNLDRRSERFSFIDSPPPDCKMMD